MNDADRAITVLIGFGSFAHFTDGCSIRSRLCSIVHVLALALAPALAIAQSLEPRLYLPLPIGLQMVVPSYAYSSGDVVVDGTLPITDFRSTSSTLTLAYVRTFGLLGRSAQVQAVVPFTTGTAEGAVAAQDTSRELTGFVDPQLRFSVNLKGGPARRRAELAGIRLGTVLGASAVLVVPLGEYERDRYLNVGTNRWALKTELGLVQPVRPGWAIEGYAGLWLFGDNEDFLDTSTVSQDPLWTFQVHVVHLLGRRGWIALDGTLVHGGATEVDGTVQNTYQSNLRFGATGAWTLGGGHALRAAFSDGVYTRLGGDYFLFTVGHSYTWGS